MLYLNYPYGFTKRSKYAKCDEYWVLVRSKHTYSKLKDRLISLGISEDKVFHSVLLCPKPRVDYELSSWVSNAKRFREDIMQCAFGVKFRRLLISDLVFDEYSFKKLQLLVEKLKQGKTISLINYDSYYGYSMGNILCNIIKDYYNLPVEVRKIDVVCGNYFKRLVNYSVC